MAKCPLVDTVYLFGFQTFECPECDVLLLIQDKCFVRPVIDLQPYYRPVDAKLGSQVILRGLSWEVSHPQTRGHLRVAETQLM